MGAGMASMNGATGVGGTNGKETEKEEKPSVGGPENMTCTKGKP